MITVVVVLGTRQLDTFCNLEARDKDHHEGGECLVDAELMRRIVPEMN